MHRPRSRETWPLGKMRSKRPPSQIRHSPPPPFLQVEKAQPISFLHWERHPRHSHLFSALDRGTQLFCFRLQALKPLNARLAWLHLPQLEVRHATLFAEIV